MNKTITREPIVHQSSHRFTSRPNINFSYITGTSDNIDIQGDFFMNIIFKPNLWGP